METINHLTNCSGCGQNIEEVAELHEKYGHNVQCVLRYDIVHDDTLCEDCIDDILENIKD